MNSVVLIDPLKSVICLLSSIYQIIHVMLRLDLVGTTPNSLLLGEYWEYFLLLFVAHLMIILEIGTVQYYEGTWGYVNNVDRCEFRRWLN